MENIADDLLEGIASLAGRLRDRMLNAKEKPATVRPVGGLRIPVGSGGPNDPKHSEENSDKQEFVLATLRCVSLRIRMIEHEIAAAGTALKGGLISPEKALEWAEEVAPGCLGIVAEQIRKPREVGAAA